MFVLRFANFRMGPYLKSVPPSIARLVPISWDSAPVITTKLSHSFARPRTILPLYPRAPTGEVSINAYMCLRPWDDKLLYGFI